jgi:copper chaperone CopZ
VRSALLDVKGVKRAIVTLEKQEAVVTYDPHQAKVEDLIAAVRQADGPGAPFNAILKGPTKQ